GRVHNLQVRKTRKAEEARGPGHNGGHQAQEAPSADAYVEKRGHSEARTATKMPASIREKGKRIKRIYGKSLRYQPRLLFAEGDEERREDYDERDHYPFPLER
ncbi:MAG: hypothetical protein ACP5LS_05875, partial [Thermoprotei archaeon]